MEIILEGAIFVSDIDMGLVKIFHENECIRIEFS